MRKKEFSCHLTTLTPSLKKLINSIQHTRYFGMYDAADLLQETMISLYMKVPKSYDEKKGKNKVKGHAKRCKCQMCKDAKFRNLKNYCMEAARNCLKRIAHRQYRYQATTSIDWSSLGQKKEADYDNDVLGDDIGIRAAALKKTKVEPKRQSIIFKVKLEELAKVNRNFHVVKTVFKHDSNRKLACSALGISNASITKAFKHVKRYRQAFTLHTTSPVKEYMENRVNAFARKGV